jgi:hypothetical protein
MYSYFDEIGWFSGVLCNFLKIFVKFRIYRCHPVHHMERSRHAVKSKALANETFAEIARLVTRRQTDQNTAYHCWGKGGGGRGSDDKVQFYS